MTLRATFPGTSAAFPRLMNWDQPFDWSDEAAWTAAIELADKQPLIVQLGQAPFLQFCDLVADDISAQAPPADADAFPENVDAFRQLFSAMPMDLCLRWGLLGDCYGWAMWSMRRHCDRRGRRFDGLWNAVLAPVGISHFAWPFVRSNIPRWTSSIFMLARKFGGLDAVCERIAESCWALCLTELFENRDTEAAFEALGSLANWASDADRIYAGDWIRTLLELWPADLPPQIRAQLGVLFMSAAHRFTGRSSRDWARELLDQWPASLTDHTAVQVLGAYIESAEDWQDERDRIMGAISALARLYARGAPNRFEAVQALESRVGVLHQLIFKLTEYGLLEALLDILGAWYLPNGRTCDDNVLFVLAGYKHGVAYLWPTGRLFLERGADEATLDRLLAAASAAQRDYHRAGAVGDVIPAIDHRRMGQPDEAAGPAFEQAARIHFEPARLAVAVGEARPRSIIVVPSLPAPISALLATDANLAVANEASLTAAAPDRLIRRVALWQGSTLHAQFEADAVRRVAERSGWEISIYGGRDDAASFTEFYADRNADLLWMIGHGEHSPYRLEASGLVVGDAIITADQLTREPLGEGRRLLVLNVCSGAATQIRGGMARIGLSQELTSPEQQVIAHLWPIGMYAGLTFGAKLALQLSTQTAVDALAATVCAMRRPGALRAELRDQLGDDLEIHRRLEHHDDQIGNVMGWGAPVLLT